MKNEKLIQAFDDFCLNLECCECKYQHCNSITECFNAFKSDKIIMVEYDENVFQQVLNELKEMKQSLNELKEMIKK